MKRTGEELERLSREIPSLGLHASVARAAVALLRGDGAYAAEQVGSVLAAVPPRSFIGWGAMSGAMARGCNAVGDHARAKRICDSTLAELSEADQALTAMYLILHLELAIAEAHLGQHERAAQRIDALIERHRVASGPVTMGSLHRTHALIAIHIGDHASARHHLEEMEAWFKPTKNPSLLQQCERLRARLAPGDAALPSGIRNVDPNATAVDHQISSPEGETSAQRRDRVLSIILRQTASEQGYLFDVRGAPVQLAPTRDAVAPEHVLDQVRRDVRSFERNRRRASTELDMTQLTSLGAGTEFTRTALRPRDHDYRTIVLSVDGERAVAAAAVLAGDGAATLPESLARSLARVLLEGGDAMTTRVEQDRAATELH
jgi:hypothetical protein